MENGSPKVHAEEDQDILSNRQVIPERLATQMQIQHNACHV
jgi:hypothetical protein